LTALRKMKKEESYIIVKESLVIMMILMMWKSLLNLLRQENDKFRFIGQSSLAGRARWRSARCGRRWQTHARG